MCSAWCSSHPKAIKTLAKTSRTSKINMQHSHSSAIRREIRSDISKADSMLFGEGSEWETPVCEPLGHPIIAPTIPSRRPYIHGMPCIIPCMHASCDAIPCIGHAWQALCTWHAPDQHVTLCYYIPPCGITTRGACCFSVPCGRVR